MNSVESFAGAPVTPPVLPVSVRSLTVRVPQILPCRVGRPRSAVPPRHSEKTPQNIVKSETGPGRLTIKGMPEVDRSGAGNIGEARMMSQLATIAVGDWIPTSTA